MIGGIDLLKILSPKTQGVDIVHLGALFCRSVERSLLSILNLYLSFQHYLVFNKEGVR